MRISFLLGAGCEGTGQLDIPSGAAFKRDTILAKDAEILIKRINQGQYVDSIRKGCILSPNSTSILYQTIIEDRENYAGLHLKKQEKRIIDEYCKYKSGVQIKNNDKCIKSFQQLFREKIYCSVIKDDLSEDEKKQIDAFLEKACFFQEVDSLFNYLRRPERYISEVGKVMKLYCAAFLSVCRAIVGKDVLQAYLKKNTGDIQSSRKELQELINEGELQRISEKITNPNLYYSIIADFARSHSDIKTRIVTSNYTGFVSRLTGLSSGDISYIHGKLELFEDINTKQVADISTFKATDIIFPHIFIQSGTKPVVSAFQIQELSKAVDMLLNSDKLIVLGYGINSDDEHISNLLRERLRNGKSIICFLYGNDDTTANKKRIEKELCSNNIVFEHAQNISEYLKNRV